MRNTWALLVFLTVLCSVTVIQLIFDFQLAVDNSGLKIGVLVTNRQGRNSVKGQFVPEDEDEFICVTKDVCLYSAYYDNIGSPTPKIRLIGVDIFPPLNEELSSCVYYDENGQSTSPPVPAVRVSSTDPYNLLDGHHGLTFFLCDIDDLNSNVTKTAYVQLQLMHSEKTKTRNQNQSLLIHYPPLPSNNDDTAIFQYQVVACVQPLHSGFEHPISLLEWIEYHRMIGVEHFTFYNNSIGFDTGEVLLSYDQSVMRIMDMSLPFQDIRVYGQFVAASDCAYRYRGVAKYVMTFDTDEFLILPRGVRSFPTYFDKLWERFEDERKVGINYIKFKSKVSFKNWPKDERKMPLKPEYYELRDVLNLLILPWRTKFHPAVQTKFVMRPDRIIESGVHWAEAATNGTTWIEMGHQDAFYFHFRECSDYFKVPNQVLENNATCNVTEGMQRDAYASRKFGSQIVDRVAKKIMSSESLMDVAANLGYNSAEY